MNSVATKYNKTLSQYYQNQPLWFDDKMDEPNVRKCDEQAHQQIEAEMWDSLTSTLEDIFFLEAKVKCGMIFMLANEFHRTLVDIPIEHSHYKIISLLNEALLRDIHFIDRHSKDYPQALFQCLYNSCCWYDGPDASDQYIQNETNHNTSPENKKEVKIHKLMDQWYKEWSYTNKNLTWVRSLRPLQTRLGGPLKAVYRGHNKPVTCVAISRSNNLIASGSADDTIILWNIAFAHAIKCLKGHKRSITALSISTKGDLIASGSYDKTIKVWDIKSGKEVKYFSEFDEAVYSVAFSPDGKTIAGGSYKTLKIWNINSGDSYVLEDNLLIAKCLDFSPDGKYLVSGSGDSRGVDCILRVWDLEAKKVKLRLIGHLLDINSVKFSPDGRTIISGSSDKTIRIWDANTGIELECLSEFSNSINCAAFSPDGKRFVCGSEDTFQQGENLKIWDLESDNQMVRLYGHTDSVNDVCFSKDGQNIISCSNDNTIRIWDALCENEPIKLKRQTGEIKSQVLSSNEKIVVSGGEDGEIIIWDSITGKTTYSIDCYKSEVSALALSSDSTKIACGLSDSTIRIWDIKTDSEILKIKNKVNSDIWDKLDPFLKDQLIKAGAQVEPIVKKVVFSPDNQKIISFSIDECIRVWDLKKGNQLFNLDCDGHKITEIAYSSYGNYIAAGSSHGVIIMWNAKTGKHLKEIYGHRDEILKLTFTSNEKHLISYTSKNEYKIWNTDTYECVKFINDKTNIFELKDFYRNNHIHVSDNEDELIFSNLALGSNTGFYPVEKKHISISNRTICENHSERTFAWSTNEHLVIVKIENNKNHRHKG